jgi:hypothetical protein
VDAGASFSLHRQPPSSECPVGMNIENILGNILAEVDHAVEGALAKITVEKVLRAVEPRSSRARRGRARS